MNYTIEFQKTYTVSEKLVITVYIVIDETGYPRTFICRETPSPFIVGKKQYSWNCDEYTFYTIDVIVPIEQVVSSFESDEPVCQSWNVFCDNKDDVDNVYWNHP